MAKNIVLIGFMGVGKSLVARILSAKTKRKVISTDELIVARAGKSIVQIFKDQGEDHFRGLEKQIVEEVCDNTDAIIDCGGGIALKKSNMELLKRNGIVFYLSASADEIYNNVKDQKHRPLLNLQDPKGKIRDLLDKRQPYYQKADYMIDANGKTGEQLSIDILEIYKTH